MLTYEVKRLIEWLESVNSSNNEKDSISFTEPNLEFFLYECPKKGKCLQISLAYECSPPWFDKKRKYVDSLKINFPISELDLTDQILKLRQQIELFPERPEKYEFKTD